MKIPIDIRIRSERICMDLSRHGAEDRSETDNLSLTGTMKKTKGGFRIEFCEENNTVTTIIDTFEDNMVSINRVGPINSHMVFSDSKALTCICDTGFFPLQMLVRTKKLENSLTMQGGQLDIDYSVEIVGNLAERNRVTFSVWPDKSIIKS